MNRVTSWVKSKGYRLNKTNKETYIIIYDQEIAIKLRERTICVSSNKYSWGSVDYKPTGKLYFKISRWWSEVEYKEGSKSLEEQLPAMFTRMEQIAKEQYELHLKHEEKREKERKSIELQKQKEACCKTELSNLKKLLQETERWHKFQILREYINAWQNRKDNSVNEKESERINWAREKINWYDPFINKPDELLELVDRDTLTMEKKESIW